MWKRFVEMVMHHFAFLETDFGFKVKPSKLPFIYYESTEVEVIVYYDVNRRHELAIQIRRLRDNPRLGVGLGELMRLTDWQAAGGYRSPYPSNETSLETEVQHLAELLKKYGPTLLMGDERTFERIEQLRREREKEMAASRQMVNRLKKMK